MSEDMSLPPEHTGPQHYYGDSVRVLFVVAAALLIGSQFFGGAFLTVPAVLIASIVLVVAAGLTNPVQTWVHWMNVALSALGLLISGSAALSRFQAGFGLDASIAALILSIIFLIALYLSTRTLRGSIMRYAPEIH